MEQFDSISSPQVASITISILKIKKYWTTLKNKVLNKHRIFKNVCSWISFYLAFYRVAPTLSFQLRFINKGTTLPETLKDNADLSTILRCCSDIFITTLFYQEHNNVASTSFNLHQDDTTPWYGGTTLQRKSNCNATPLQRRVFPGVQNGRYDLSK